MTAGAAGPQEEFPTAAAGPDGLRDSDELRDQDGLGDPDELRDQDGFALSPVGPTANQTPSLP